MFSILIMCFCVLAFIQGGYFLLSSPYVFRMDKKSNCCTKGRKFIWQEKYKIETLCKLSEVKNSTRIGGIFCNYVGLYLTLKSGKVVAIFSEGFFNGFLSSKLRSMRVFDKQANEINNFLNSEKKLYIAEQPLIFRGISWMLGCLLLILILFVLYKPL